jgi:hypothetical protein
MWPMCPLILTDSEERQHNRPQVVKYVANEMQVP